MIEFLNHLSQRSNSIRYKAEKLFDDFKKDFKEDKINKSNNEGSLITSRFQKNKTLMIQPLMSSPKEAEDHNIFTKNGYDRVKKIEDKKRDILECLNTI